MVRSVPDFAELVSHTQASLQIPSKAGQSLSPDVSHVIRALGVAWPDAAELDEGGWHRMARGNYYQQPSQVETTGNQITSDHSSQSAKPARQG